MLVNIHCNPPKRQGQRFDTLISPSGSVATLLKIEEELGRSDIVGIDEAFPDEIESEKEIRRLIEQSLKSGDKPILLFTTLFYNAERSVNLARQLKQDYGSDIQIVFGGQLVPLAESAYLENENIDSICVGDAEIILPQLLQDAGQGQLQQKYEGWVRNLEAKKYAGVSYDHFYAIFERMAEQKRLAGFTQLTIQGPGGPGCAWASRNGGEPCNFCALQNITTMSDRTIEESLGNERELEDDFQPDRFFDTANQFIPVLGREQAQEWLRHYISVRNQLGLGAKKYAYLTVSSIDSEIAGLLTQAGVSEVYLGIDHFNPEALRAEGKPHRTREQLQRALDGLRDNGIQFRAGIVLGAARETPETLLAVRDGVQWMVDNYGKSLNALGVFPVEIIPGSAIFEKMRQSGACAHLFEKFETYGYLTRSEQQELTRSYIADNSESSPEDIFGLEAEIAEMVGREGRVEYTVDEKRTEGYALGEGFGGEK